ncbi:MAG: GntR family transcriptional regulator [Burkholderiales bacterium]|nr:GntR family transcriptional regulator [Burkholderiales bacterium]
MKNITLRTPVHKKKSAQSLSALRVPDLVRLLRDRISTHTIAPATPLREAALAQEFFVSRAYVRDALSSLEERRLVERIPNVGARVVKIDLELAIKIYETREALESQSVRLATINSKPGDWKSFQTKFHQARQLFQANGSVEEYLCAINDFRQRCTELADNPVLLDFQEMMLDRTRMIIRRVAILPGRPAQGLAEHAALVTAMDAGDAEKAAQLARENIRSALQFLIRYKDFVF